MEIAKSGVTDMIKKYIFRCSLIVALLLIISFFTLLCSFKVIKKNNTQDSTDLFQSNNAFEEYNEITLGTYFGSDIDIYLIMNNPKYEENWSNDLFYGESFGRIFKGDCVLVLRNSLGEELDRINLSSYFSFKCEFDDFFDIMTSDYNEDGYMDFAIGQKITSSTYEYQIFTIIDSKIILLTAKGDEIMSELREYSPILKTNDKTIITSTYSKQDGRMIDNYYVWDEDNFIYSHNNAD